MTRLEKFLIRLAMSGKLPFSRQFLAWSSERQFADLEPMSSMRFDFEIPDQHQPIPEDERGAVGPSGHLLPFMPKVLSAEQIVGRKVDEILTHVGTYGMGGPGFFGLRLGDEWLVFAIWSASEWITVDGLLIQDHFFEDYERPRPWITGEADNLSPLLLGSVVTSLELNQRSMRMSFSNGMSLTIDEAPENRPVFQGNKRPREFLEDDDLRKAVFLAPTAEIWV
ncbi:hypothetical protein [Sulfitobacter mediterraneus]|uniref:hypothetical protein n=1 Tax=Sulfitobacter mediterraneus TaxID=83219 RepID=UPI00248F88A6|nr:hypothetical protein [Sulfitobacter mediterraneus]